MGLEKITFCCHRTTVTAVANRSCLCPRTWQLPQVPSRIVISLTMGEKVSSFLCRHKGWSFPLPGGCTMYVPCSTEFIKAALKKLARRFVVHWFLCLDSFRSSLEQFSQALLYIFLKYTGIGSSFRFLPRSEIHILLKMTDCNYNTVAKLSSSPCKHWGWGVCVYIWGYTKLLGQGRYLLLEQLPTYRAQSFGAEHSWQWMGVQWRRGHLRQIPLCSCAGASQGPFRKFKHHSLLLIPCIVVIQSRPLPHTAAWKGSPFNGDQCNAELDKLWEPPKEILVATVKNDVWRSPTIPGITKTHGVPPVIPGITKPISLWGDFGASVWQKKGGSRLGNFPPKCFGPARFSKSNLPLCTCQLLAQTIFGISLRDAWVPSLTALPNHQTKKP